MKLRLITGVPLALAVAALLWWAPWVPFLLVLILTVEIGLGEFFGVARHAGFKTFPVMGYAAGLLVCLGQLAIGRSVVPAALFLAVLLVASLALLLTADLKQYLGAVSTTIFGTIYVAFTMSCLVPLRYSRAEPAWATGRELIFLLFLVIWAGDIFSYFTGRTMGRTPLAPRISPKKTVEGAVGGLAGSLLVAWCFTHWFWQTADLKKVMLWAGTVAVAGQVGDLVESALKRSGDVKDSGTLLPGHGGLLDRIDSLLFGAPALWLLVTMNGLWK